MTDRPVSPEERLQELNSQVAAVAGRLRCSGSAPVRHEGERLARLVKEVRAALSTPAGPGTAPDRDAIVSEVVDATREIARAARGGPRHGGVTHREAALYDKGYDDALDHVLSLVALSA